MNTINKAAFYGTILDEIVRGGLTSAFLEGGAAGIVYNGGGTCNIPKISVTGYGKYDRSSTTPYAAGSVTQEWEPKIITQDRGVEFGLDAMDQDETKFVLSVTNTISVFAKTQAIPEKDSYRYSKIFQEIVDDTTVKYGYYTPAAATLFSTVQDKISDIEDVVGDNADLVCIMSGAAFKFITNSTELQKQLGVQDRTAPNGVTTKIYNINGVEIIPVPSARMKTEYLFNDAGGFSAKAWAQDINFIIMARNAAVAFVKYDDTRVFGPEVNQRFKGDLVQSRCVHDCWVYDNKKDTMYVSLKTAMIDSISSLLTAGSGKVTYTVATWASRDTKHEYYYLDTDSAAAPTVPACYDDIDLTGYTKIATASATDVTVTTTHHLIIVQVDENGRVIEFGSKAAS